MSEPKDEEFETLVSDPQIGNSVANTLLTAIDAMSSFVEPQNTTLGLCIAFAAEVRRLGMVHEDAHNMLDACLKAEIVELPAKRGQA